MSPSPGAPGPARTFPDHLEEHLGEIESATWLTEEGAEPRVAAVRFPDRPVQGGVTYCTLGLSKVHLHQPRERVRQELLYAQRGERAPFEAAHVLQSVVDELLGSRTALLRGELIPPRGPVLADSELEGLLCVHPGLHPESFEVYDDPQDDLPVVLVMLVPVSRDEVAYLEQHGRGAFEALIERLDPDLMDWRRAPLVRMDGHAEPCPGCGRAHGRFLLADGTPLRPRNCH